MPRMTRAHSEETTPSSKRSTPMSESQLQPETPPAKRAKTVLEALRLPDKDSHFGAENVVTLLVGDDERKMIAHKHHLTQDSEFFVTALRKAWLNVHDNTIRLVEECPSTFTHYLSFLYSGKLFTRDITIEDQYDAIVCSEKLASLYVLGERFRDKRLQSVVVEDFVRLATTPDEYGECWDLTSGTVNTIYRGTTEHSAGRRLLVDLYVHKGAETWLEGDLEPEFVLDVAKAFYQKTKGSELRDREVKAKDYY